MLNRKKLQKIYKNIFIPFLCQSVALFFIPCVFIKLVAEVAPRLHIMSQDRRNDDICEIFGYVASKF